MTQKKKSKSNVIPRSGDIALSWLTRDHGEKWEVWRELAAAWLSNFERGLGHRMAGLRAFFEDFVVKLDLPTNPLEFCSRDLRLPDFVETCYPDFRVHGVEYSNHAHVFLKWALETRFSEPDDYGRPVVPPNLHNPVPLRSLAGLAKHTESVHSPMPYRYIRELREILAPGRHFQDWKWAQEVMGRSRGTWRHVAGRPLQQVIE